MKHQERLTAAGVVGGIGLVGALVTFSVLSAQNAGRERLQQLQQAQVEQLARGMNTRMEQAFTAFQGFVTAPPAFHASLRDASDAARLKTLQDLQPKATTGMLIVDAEGDITNGTLLRDPASLGRRLDRPGLAQVLAGEAAVLPVAPGLTTSVPTIAIAYPLKSAAGAVIGAFVLESEVAATSSFNQEIAQLGGARNASYAFLDSNGRVVASNDATMLGKLFDSRVTASTAVGVRRLGGDLIVSEPVPAAKWRVVFRQPVHDFEGSLTDPIRSALLLMALLTIVLAGAAGFALVRQLRRSKVEQDRLVQLGHEREEFISIVSHELRTPVLGVLGFLQTTLDHWDAMHDGDRRRAVSRAAANASRLYMLSRDVLDSSAIESGHLQYTKELIDLRDVLTTTVMTTQELHPGRTVSLTADSDPIWVMGDPERLQQVVVNLVENGLKASPEDSPLTVTVAAQDGHAVVVVRDHGPGLEEPDLDRAFDKFVRGRSRTVGSGLGLYICQQIVQGHEGTISVRNAPDGGAEFTVELPASAAPKHPVDA
jgi:nitrogen-specific signal transduction histidine kinase